MKNEIVQFTFDSIEFGEIRVTAKVLEVFEEDANGGLGGMDAIVKIMQCPHLEEMQKSEIQDIRDMALSVLYSVDYVEY